MKILRKTKALNADLDSLIQARSFLEKLIDMINDAQLYKDYEKNLAESTKQVCGDTIEVNGHKDKEPWFGNDQPIDAQTVVQTIRCIKSGNHSGNHKSYNPFRLGEKFLEWPNTEDKKVRLDFCNKQYVSTVDSDTYYCLLQPNHDGKCGYSVPEIHQRIKDETERMKG